MANLAIQLSGHMAIRLSGYLAIWSPGLLAIWSSGDPFTRLPEVIGFPSQIAVFAAQFEDNETDED